MTDMSIPSFSSGNFGSLPFSMSSESMLQSERRTLQRRCRNLQAPYTNSAASPLIKLKSDRSPSSCKIQIINKKRAASTKKVELHASPTSNRHKLQP